MEELQRLQALLDELLQSLERTLSTGEVLSDELQGLIAEQIEWLVQRIQQLEQSLSQPQAPSSIPKVASGMPSSNVKGVNYDPDTGNMNVQYLGKYPNTDGPVYQYSDVPPMVAELIQSGAIPARTKGSNRWGSWFPGKHPSAGASVNTLLKETGVDYRRLS